MNLAAEKALTAATLRQTGERLGVPDSVLADEWHAITHNIAGASTGGACLALIEARRDVERRLAARLELQAAR